MIHAQLVRAYDGNHFPLRVRMDGGRKYLDAEDIIEWLNSLAVGEEGEVEDALSATVTELRNAVDAYP